MLRKRVLDRAVKEINKKTDINLHYELKKEGRKITTIQFNIDRRNSKTESN